MQGSDFYQKPWYILMYSLFKLSKMEAFADKIIVLIALFSFWRCGRWKYICNQMKNETMLSITAIIVSAAHTLLERNTFSYALENDRWMQWMQQHPEADAAL